MSDISDKILGAARKHLETQDRRGKSVKDFRKTKSFDRYVQNAEKAGVVSALKSPDKPEGGPTYMNGLDAFLDSDQFKRYRKIGKGQGHSFEWDPTKSLYVPGKGGKGTKAPGISTVADIRENWTTERGTDIIGLGVRQRRIRTYFAQIPTTASAYTTMRETGFVNAAAGRPENIDSASVVHALESRISTDWPTIKVHTTDHMISFPKELMDDIPALRAWINERGLDGVDDAEDANMISGAGDLSNEHLGMLVDPDVPTYEWSSGDLGDNMADAVLGAHIEVLAAEYAPDLTLLSIQDHAGILKLKDKNENYLFPAAHRSGETDFALWGVPTDKTTALPTGDGVTGAFRKGGEYRSRNLVEYRLTDSHGNYFSANVLHLVVGRRAGFGLNRPESFRKLEFDSAPV